MQRLGTQHIVYVDGSGFCWVRKEGMCTGMILGIGILYIITMYTCTETRNLYMHMHVHVDIHAHIQWNPLHEDTPV